LVRKTGAEISYQVGHGAVTEVEADGQSTQIALGVIRRLRVAAAHREPRRDRHGFGEMRGLGELGGIGRRRELAGQTEPLVVA
jgi:hypothetical protein